MARAGSGLEHTPTPYEESSDTGSGEAASRREGTLASTTEPLWAIPDNEAGAQKVSHLPELT